VELKYGHSVSFMVLFMCSFTEDPRLPMPRSCVYVYFICDVNIASGLTAINP